MPFDDDRYSDSLLDALDDAQRHWGDPREEETLDFREKGKDEETLRDLKRVAPSQLNTDSLDTKTADGRELTPFQRQRLKQLTEENQ